MSLPITISLAILQFPFKIRQWQESRKVMDRACAVEAGELKKREKLSKEAPSCVAVIADMATDGKLSPNEQKRLNELGFAFEVKQWKKFDNSLKHALTYSLMPAFAKAFENTYRDLDGIEEVSVRLEAYRKILNRKNVYASIAIEKQCDECSLQEKFYHLLVKAAAPIVGETFAEDATATADVEFSPGEVTIIFDGGFAVYLDLEMIDSELSKQIALEKDTW